MATSFIAYKNKGYWVADSFVSLLARYLIETRKKMLVKKHHWQSKMKDDLIPIALGQGSGAKDLFLDEYLDRDYKIEDYISWIEQAKEYLSLKGKFIPKDELISFDYMGDEVLWNDDLETETLIDLYDELINIVKGKSGGEPNSKSVLPYNKVNE
jgi:hypothetical protein